MNMFILLLSSYHLNSVGHLLDLHNMKSWHRCVVIPSNHCTTVYTMTCLHGLATLEE